MAQDVASKQLRSFGLLVGSIFAVIGVWPSVWYRQDPRFWALLIGLGLIGLALVFPRSLRWVYRAWMAIGEVLGWINTRIILGIIFYGVVTPMGMIMRWSGRDVMHRSLNPDAETYRIVREPRARSHMERQF